MNIEHASFGSSANKQSSHGKMETPEKRERKKQRKRTTFDVTVRFYAKRNKNASNNENVWKDALRIIDLFYSWHGMGYLMPLDITVHARYANLLCVRVCGGGSHQNVLSADYYLSFARARARSEGSSASQPNGFLTIDDAWRQWRQPRAARHDRTERGGERIACSPQ